MFNIISIFTNPTIVIFKYTRVFIHIYIYVYLQYTCEPIDVV